MLKFILKGKENQMTVKQLIKELLNLEMDAEVEIVFEKKNGNYKYRSVDSVTDYYDGSVGIVGYKNLTNED